MKTLVVLLLGACAVSALPYMRSAPRTIPGVIRGDIILTPEQDEYFFGSKKRTGLTPISFRWPNNTVPYSFDGQNKREKALIRSSLDEMEQHLCITFVERTTEKDYVRITMSDSGCFSEVGHLGRPQQLNLDPGCYEKVIVQHEFIHVLGFFHMQSAYDRDDYIEIIWENIITEMKYNFDKVNPDTTSQFDLPYDYFSIMHYPYWAFSDNGKPTMVSRDPNISLDYRYVMTSTDIQRIRNMYCP